MWLLFIGLSQGGSAVAGERSAEAQTVADRITQAVGESCDHAQSVARDVKHLGQLTGEESPPEVAAAGYYLAQCISLGVSIHGESARLFGSGHAKRERLRHALNSYRRMAADLAEMTGDSVVKDEMLAANHEARGFNLWFESQVFTAEQIELYRQVEAEPDANYSPAQLSSHRAIQRWRTGTLRPTD